MLAAAAVHCPLLCLQHLAFQCNYSPSMTFRPNSPPFCSSDSAVAIHCLQLPPPDGQIRFRPRTALLPPLSIQLPTAHSAWQWNLPAQSGSPPQSRIGQRDATKRCSFDKMQIIRWHLANQGMVRLQRPSGSRLSPKSGLSTGIGSPLKSQRTSGVGVPRTWV
jgi:hypothetical protein